MSRHVLTSATTSGERGVVDEVIRYLETFYRRLFRLMHSDVFFKVPLTEILQRTFGRVFKKNM